MDEVGTTMTTMGRRCRRPIRTSSGSLPRTPGEQPARARQGLHPTGEERGDHSMWHDDGVGREAATAGENPLEQGQRGSAMDRVYAGMHSVAPSSREEGTGMSAAAHVLSWVARVPLPPCAGQTATAVLERMVRAALGRRGRAMLIG